MEIWVKNDEYAMQLPVLPSSFELNSLQNNTVVNINEIGEVNLLGKRGLESISISSFFPNQHYSFCKVQPLPPYEYCNILKKWKDDNELLRFIITNTNINMPCTIESFTFGEADGLGDVTYKVDFKEYRSISTARVTKVYKTKKYKVKKHDTWYKIARKFTGNSANASKIAKYNKSKVKKRPKKGKKVVIKYEA